ncbi:hypothetical protein BFP76_03800 [Amylibacter kogurei]|uniref:VWFA domain-containing protein n=1 Tax=Paramylibacter kogurei TaxID=1889778 RepID=A0A2G5K5F1_9RHOB|nr:VWA domain-containing protein [Amylibacter kogurei]PIB24349.1 hypothetical protein BFP76_03800 [Amylibacter kogurei]
MRTVLIFTSLVSISTFANAQESSVDCDALYQRFVDEYPIDLASCDVSVAPYTLDECPVPQTKITKRPTSHMILAIDASGSMAGKLGKDTKMNIAKREAISFLNDIPNEVNVGLVVYGHQGNNQDDGKALSCSASEMVHGFKSRRSKIKDSIADLSPNGWTPLGGVLEFIGNELAQLSPPKDGDLAPVVYLISDGKETCGGDPVGAATALVDAGINTIVNTIGFDVDDATATQLQAISDTAGGTYFAAKDANALRNQLNAIKDAEAQQARFNYCTHLNAGRIGVVYHNAYVSLAGCYKRNDPSARQVAMIHYFNKATKENAPEAACADVLSQRIKDEVKPYRGWLKQRSTPLIEEPKKLISDYRAEMKQQLENRE